MSYWQDKTVLITGGTSGIGRILAAEFGRRGARIGVIGLESDVTDEAVLDLRDAGLDAWGKAADVTRQDDVDSLFGEAFERFKHLDVLVNCAGRTDRGKVLDTTPEDFASLLELNFLATVRCTRAAVPRLIARRGHLVNMGSLAAKSAARWVGAYPVSKFAVAAYSQQLRLELGPQGLHVLLVCPGPIERKDDRLYPLRNSEDIPETALRPGAGVRTKKIPPELLARKILAACEKRRPELVIPSKAKLLFAIGQLWPGLGDWIVCRKT